MSTKLHYSPVQIAGLGTFAPFSLSIQENSGVMESLHFGLGYGHRGIEYTSESLAFQQCVNFSDRVDYTAAPAYNTALVEAFEGMGMIEIPARARYIRTVLLELNRIHSHVLFLANIAQAAGHLPLFHYALREREQVSDLFEMYCGSRLGFGSICIGGVVENATDGWLYKLEQRLSGLEDFLREANAVLVQNPIFSTRLNGLAELSAAAAMKNNISGVNARASGSRMDLRRSAPYAAYGDLVLPERKWPQSRGDGLSRLKYRMEEIREAKDIIHLVLAKMPSGSHRVEVGNAIRLPKGEAVRRVEGPRGELGVFVRSEGGVRPVRLKYFTPSFFVIRILPELLLGEEVEDLFLGIHSFDVSFSEADR